MAKKRKGKQIGIGLTDAEAERLDAILERVNREHDSNYTFILREFLGLRPRKVTLPGDLEFLNGKSPILPKSNQSGGQQAESADQGLADRKSDEVTDTLPPRHVRRGKQNLG